MKFTYRCGQQPLPGYTIKRGIGWGGFGEVYFAVSESGKEVALKWIRSNLDVELRGVQQCLNLKHPNLIQGAQVMAVVATRIVAPYEREPQVGTRFLGRLGAGPDDRRSAPALPDIRSEQRSTVSDSRVASARSGPPAPRRRR